MSVEEKPWAIPKRPWHAFAHDRIFRWLTRVQLWIFKWDDRINQLKDKLYV